MPSRRQRCGAHAHRHQQLQTRNRAVDLSRPELWLTLMRPRALGTSVRPSCSRLTAWCARRRSTPPKGAKTEMEKVRALYDWVIANGHREPTTAGCGTGDIKTMLETGNPAANALISTPCSSASAAPWASRRVMSPRPASGAVRLPVQGTGRQFGQPERRTALPRRGVTKSQSAG